MIWEIAVLALFRSPPSISSLTHISLEGEEQNGVGNVVSVLWDVCMRLLHFAPGLFSCLSFRTTVCDGKSAGWCCNQFVRADVSLDVRVNYVRLLGENNLSVIMSFTSVNRVSSSGLVWWLAARAGSHAHRVDWYASGMWTSCTQYCPAWFWGFHRFFEVLLKELRMKSTHDKLLM